MPEGNARSAAVRSIPVGFASDGCVDYGPQSGEEIVMSGFSVDAHYWTRRAAIAGISGLTAAAPPIRNYLRVKFHMDVVFWLCAAHGYPLRDPEILDAFSGAGLSMSHAYMDRARRADLCDINADYIRLGGKLSPKVTPIHGDSFKMINEGDPRLGRYDMIILDNNLGGIYAGFCEHFDAMPAVFRHLKTDVPYGVVALNFISDPDLMNQDERFQTPPESFGEQMRRRAEFYQTDQRLLTPRIGAAAYDREARKEGWVVEDFALAPRAEYFHFLLLFLRKADR
jgi:hypothetical protein